MLNDVMCYILNQKSRRITDLNYLSYLDIYTGQHMPIGIINSVLYLDY